MGGEGWGGRQRQNIRSRRLWRNRDVPLSGGRGGRLLSKLLSPLTSIGWSGFSLADATGISGSGCGGEESGCMPRGGRAARWSKCWLADDGGGRCVDSGWGRGALGSSAVAAPIDNAAIERGWSLLLITDRPDTPWTSRSCLLNWLRCMNSKEQSSQRWLRCLLWVFRWRLREPRRYCRLRMRGHELELFST